VGRQVVKAVQKNLDTITIQIKPPQFGRLAVSIESSGNALKVNILAEHSAARDILMSHTSDLRGIISDQQPGLRVEKVDVQLSQNFDQAMADTRNGKNPGNTGFRHKGQARSGTSRVVDQAAPEDDEESYPTQDGRRVLNLIV